MNATPLPGEVPLKVWLIDEAKRRGIDPESVRVRIGRGRYPTLTKRYVNQRVIFVRELRAGMIGRRGRRK